MRDVRPDEKYCTGCSTTKPKFDFYEKKRVKTLASGRVDTWLSMYSKCKVCTDKVNNVTRPKYDSWYKQYRKDNREKISERGRKWYQKHKQQWWDLLSTVHELKCVDCGYDEHTSALDFHHKDESEKIFGINGAIKAAPTPERWESVKKEAEKCVVLCSNCHRVRHAKYNFAFGKIRAKEKK